MDCKVLSEKHERLNRLMRLHFAAYFEDFGLTAMQALTLEYIMLKSEGGDVFPKDLENFLFIRSSSVASLVNNLEMTGYIQRETASFDARYKRLVPTQKALEMKAEISRRIDEYNQSLYVGISEKDLEVYESVIEKMSKNAE